MASGSSDLNLDEISENECTNKDDFDNWLMSRVSKQSVMVSRAHGEKIIQFLREQRDKGANDSEVKAKFSPSFRFQVKKRKFQLINVVGLGDILCLPNKDKSKSSHSMLGEHRQVIFKEDMFGVIDSAHKTGEKHRGYKGTFKKINASYCNIPREIVHKYVALCKFCQKTHACYIPTTLRHSKPKKKPAIKKKPLETGFLTRCQIDILDLQNFPDIENNYSYIGHFFDHHTKYNVIFPLKQIDANTVASTLSQHVFGHFGLPTILHSNIGRKFVDELILWVLQFWSTDARIFNGNPKHKNLNVFIQQRQKTIVILIETMKTKQPEFSNWSSLLPGIQYSLNTNQFETNTSPSYDLVYHRRPKIYSYSSVESKDILKEEEVFFDIENDDDKEEDNMNEIITVSVSDFMQSGNNTLLLPQVSENLEEQKETTSNCSLTSDNIICNTIRTIPLGLNQQYTIVGTTINGDQHTIQIPVVNIDNNGKTETHAVLNLQGYQNSSNHSENNLSETRNNLELANIHPISLTNENDLNDIETSLSNENSSSHVELTNGNTVDLELTDVIDGSLEYESLTIETEHDSHVVT